MFERNEKYGQALHLQYGADNSGNARASYPNQHFGVNSFLTSLLGRGGAVQKTDIVTVDLCSELSKKAAKHDQLVQAFAVNENQTQQVGGNIAL